MMTKNPDYQLNYYITLRVHNMNGQSKVPSLRYSLLPGMREIES